MNGLILAMLTGIRRRSLAMWRDSDGVAAVVMAITLPALVAVTALAIDMGYAYWTRTQLQHAAEAAALAGANTLVDAGPADGVPDSDTYRTAAIEYAYRHMAQGRFGRVINSGCGDYNPVTSTISGSAECTDVKAGDWNAGTRTFTPWDNIGYDPGAMVLDSVRVVTRTADTNGNPLNLFLGAAVGLAQTNVNTAAIATLGGGEVSESCMIALDPSAPQSLHIQGQATITSDSCGVCVNSTDPEGLWLNGEPIIDTGTGEITVNAAGFHLEGGTASISPSPTFNGGACTDPFAGTTPFATEFTDTTCVDGTPPTICDGGDFSADPVGEVHLSPGLYCGGISFKSTGYVEFAPGTYHIKNGTLLDEGTHSYFGAGVTFLIDNATVDFGGAQDIALSAGADGSNFLFYENPDGPHPTEDHIFRGDAGANYEGIIYFPDRNVAFVGETAGTATPPECFAVIANTFNFTGTNDIQLNAAGCGGELETIGPMTLRLVD